LKLAENRESEGKRTVIVRRNKSQSLIEEKYKLPSALHTQKFSDWIKDTKPSSIKPLFYCQETEITPDKQKAPNLA